MNLAFSQPWVLVLLLLAVLPLWRDPARRLDYPGLAFLPRDGASLLLSGALRLAGAAAVAALVLALAGPHRPEHVVERVGQGAEIVLLLDRSRSMDLPFYHAGDEIHPLGAGPRRDAKGKVARRLLSEFAAGRGGDMFGMVVFSAYPMKVLDFTRNPEVVQAAVLAGDQGKGLSDTDIGRGLLAALSFFDARPYAGSRVVLLVSDGGAQIDVETREKIARQARRHRVSLYWIYIRSFRSPGLEAAGGADVAAETVPERFLHEFFQDLGVPYRAYEAANPDALRKAIEDVGRLERYPLHYTEVVPRADLAPPLYGLALVLALGLAGATRLEILKWT